MSLVEEMPQLLLGFDVGIARAIDYEHVVSIFRASIFILIPEKHATHLIFA